MTKREFILQHKSFEKGMISAYKNILNHCKVCIKSHKQELTKKRIQELIEMNKPYDRDW
jgi:hypothetical protein